MGIIIVFTVIFCRNKLNVLVQFVSNQDIFLIRMIIVIADFIINYIARFDSHIFTRLRFRLDRICRSWIGYDFRIEFGVVADLNFSLVVDKFSLDTVFDFYFQRNCAIFTGFNVTDSPGHYAVRLCSAV